MTKSAKTNPDELLQQIAELTQALQRERADATNIRRRHDEQITNLKTMVKSSLVRELLPVIDNFERALKHAPALTKSKQSGVDEQDKTVADWLNGVISIKAQFDKTLSDLGVEKIKTVGEVFDPKYHEAVSMEEGSGNIEVISDELQPGYKIGDDIIRHAMVKVRMQ